MDENELTAIWNRACFPDADAVLSPGDEALRDVILAHSVLMNGGMQHCVEALEERELTAAVRGFAHLGRPEIGAVLERAGEARADPERLEELQDEYDALVPSDETLDEMFRAHQRRHPEDFLPPSE